MFAPSICRITFSIVYIKPILTQIPFLSKISLQLNTQLHTLNNFSTTTLNSQRLFSLHTSKHYKVQTKPFFAFLSFSTSPQNTKAPSRYVLGGFILFSASSLPCHESCCCMASQFPSLILNTAFMQRTIMPIMWVHKQAKDINGCDSNRPRRSSLSSCGFTETPHFSKREMAVYAPPPAFDEAQR